MALISVARVDRAWVSSEGQTGCVYKICQQQLTEMAFEKKPNTLEELAALTAKVAIEHKFNFSLAEIEGISKDLNAWLLEEEQILKNRCLMQVSENLSEFIDPGYEKALVLQCGKESKTPCNLFEIEKICHRIFSLSRSSEGQPSEGDSSLSGFSTPSQNSSQNSPSFHPLRRTLSSNPLWIDWESAIQNQRSFVSLAGRIEVDAGEGHEGHCDETCHDKSNPHSS